MGTAEIKCSVFFILRHNSSMLLNFVVLVYILLQFLEL